MGDVVLVWFIFFLASIIIVIVLLNLLIAIMGDTFSRVLENITNLQMREKAMLVAENEVFYNRRTEFGKSQYIIVIKERNLDGGEGDQYDGMTAALRRALVEKMSSVQNELDIKIADIQKEVRKSFLDQEDKNKRQTAATTNRIVSSVKTDLEGVFNKVNILFTNLNGQVLKQQETINSLTVGMAQVATV